MLEAEHVPALDRTCHDVEGGSNRSHQLSSHSGQACAANDLDSELGCRGLPQACCHWLG